MQKAVQQRSLDKDTLEAINKSVEESMNLYIKQCETDEINLNVYATKVNAGEVPTGNIHDLNTNTEEVLKGLPNVLATDIGNKGQMSSHRFIQIKDCHFTSKEEVFSLNKEFLEITPDKRQEYGYLIYEKKLWQIRCAQQEQKNILRCLIRHHGLEEVFVEGLTENSKEVYFNFLELLRENAPNLPEFEENLRKADSILDRMAEQKLTDTPDYKETLSLRDEVHQAIEAIDRAECLVGAAGQLYVSGELKRIAVLEGEAFDKSSKGINDYERKFGANIDRWPYTKEREETMVRNLTKEKGVKVLILGGAHDLSDNAPDIEVISITTKWYQELTAHLNLGKK
jgi:hypothetical protein